MRHPCLVFTALFACSPDSFENPPPKPETQETVDLDSAPGDESCGDPLMVRITLDASTYCIDRFEAGVTGDTLGNANQGMTDADESLDGSTLARSTVGLQTEPQANLSWYQAKASCENAGKRLCTAAEWERACRGPELFVYPYGDDFEDDACNGFFKQNGNGPLLTGSLPACGSQDGIYDMSGNLAEWTSTSVERVPGTNVLNARAVRGGSFRSNFSALRCLGAEFKLPPTEVSDDLGFRCCAD